MDIYLRINVTFYNTRITMRSRLSKLLYTLQIRDAKKLYDLICLLLLFCISYIIVVGKVF